MDDDDDDDGKYLCHACLHLFESLQTPPTGGQHPHHHHPIGGSFETAARRDGCPLCSVLLHAYLRSTSDDGGIPPTPPATNLNDVWTRSSFPNGDGGAIIITVMHGSHGGMWTTPECVQLRFFFHPLPPTPQDREPDRPAEHVLPPSTDAAETFSLATRWLENSLEKHEECREREDARREGAYFPKRLIDLSAPDNPHLLLCSVNGPPTGPYATLSHCWGVGGIKLTLTTSNERQLRESIPTASLPRTFHDAVRVTAALGIKYLWIDSLCIVQDGDGGADWREHAAAMKDVYSNCIVNISADRAAHADDGFLGSRTAPVLQPVRIKCRLPTDDDHEDARTRQVAYSNAAQLSIAHEPLSQRAWVLQERLLAPRVVHFTSSQVFWECRTPPLASETFPTGFPGIQEKSAGRLAPFVLDDERLARDEAHRCSLWGLVLSNYARLRLTNPREDKLVALAGVAALFESATGERIVAGMRRARMPEALLWHVEPETVDGVRARPSADPGYRAPTWSWTSMDGPVNFLMSDIRPSYWKYWSLAEVQEVSVESVDPSNVLGQIKAAVLVLQGPAMPFVGTYPLGAEGYRDESFEWNFFFDDVMDEQRHHASGNFILWVSVEEIMFIHGIILSPVIDTSSTRDEYARIGTVQVIDGKREDFRSKEKESSRIIDELVPALEAMTATIL